MVKAAEAEAFGIVDQVTRGDPEDVGVAYAETLIAKTHRAALRSEECPTQRRSTGMRLMTDAEKGPDRFLRPQAVRAVQALQRAAL